MNFKEFKDRVAMLMNQYSLAGATIPPGYNGQSDDLLRIPAYLDSVQTMLATTTKPILETVAADWDTAEERSGFYILQLPSNFYRLTGRGFPMLRDGEYTQYHGYKMMGKDRVAIPMQDRADMEISYYRYPGKVPDTPDDLYLLDNEPDAQDAAAYYVAAYLEKDKDPASYQALYNEFELRRRQMMSKPSAQYELTADRFDINNAGVYYA